MRKSARMQSLNPALTVHLCRRIFAVLLLIACGEIFAAREMPGPAELININTASAAEIAIALPGIGPQKAQRIVEWRNSYGAFQSSEQLLDVKGIGPKTLEKIEGLYHLGDQAINLGSKTSKSSTDRWVLQDIIERANHDRLVALGLSESDDSVLPR